jgi:integrase
MPKQIAKQLTVTDVKSAAPGTHTDGEGLYLVVSKTGSRSWLLRYQLRGKRRDMGLGVFPQVTLAEARDKAAAARKLAAQGVDPIEDRRAKEAAKAAERVAPFFGEYAAKVVAGLPLKTEKQRTDWLRCVGAHHSPGLQKLRVDEVATEHVLAVMTRNVDGVPFWRAKRVTAEHTRQRIEFVLDAARAAGHIDKDRANPARWKGHLQHLIKRPKHKAKHQRAAPYERAAEIYAKLAAACGMGARAGELQYLTAVRPIEARFAQWGLIDLDEAVWLVPGENMKNGAHMDDEFFAVPLSTQAVALLRSLLPPGGSPAPDAYVFPTSHRTGRRHPGAGKSKPIGKDAARWAMQRAGIYDVSSVHGFRATFRSWAGDETDHPRDLLEMCIGHKVKETEAAYSRGEALRKRRVIMQDWADRITDPARDKVVPFLKRRAA